jgi:hypothetical protein
MVGKRRKKARAQPGCASIQACAGGPEGYLTCSATLTLFLQTLDALAHSRTHGLTIAMQTLSWN